VRSCKDTAPALRSDEGEIGFASDRSGEALLYGAISSGWSRAVLRHTVVLAVSGCTCRPFGTKLLPFGAHLECVFGSMTVDLIKCETAVLAEIRCRELQVWRWMPRRAARSAGRGGALLNKCDASAAGGVYKARSVARPQLDELAASAVLN
jgi:hypothetical protein